MKITILFSLVALLASAMVANAWSCVCPAVWDPVCGVDRKTYGNSCKATCAGVKVAYPGECRAGYNS